MSFYIALEGIEGVGKTTCQRQLAELMKQEGQRVECVHEPGDTPVGKIIREYLLSGVETFSPWGEAAMFAADRAELVDKRIRPALEKGEWVLSDRSVYSSLAYQSIPLGLDLQEVRRMNEAVMGGIWPDLVVLLEIETGQGLARQEDADYIGSRGQTYMSAVASVYDQLAREESDLFVRVEARSPIDIVVEQVKKRIRASQHLTLWTSGWVQQDNTKPLDSLYSQGKR